MLRDLAGATVPEKDYHRLADACRFDRTFPATFAEWERLVREGTKLAEESGRAVTRVDVDVDEFLRWSAVAHIRPCMDAIRAFLIVKRFGLQAALDNISGLSRTA
jgi:hypothetical protein